MRTPAGHRVSKATQEHHAGQPCRGAQQVLILHAQDPHTLAKDS